MREQVSAGKRPLSRAQGPIKPQELFGGKGQEMKNYELSNSELDRKRGMGSGSSESRRSANQTRSGSAAPSFSRKDFQNWLVFELERLEADFSDYVTARSSMKDIQAAR